MSGFGFHLNPEYTKPWITQVGKFILNFGAVEHLSYFWLAELGDELTLDQLLALNFNRRVERVKSLIGEASLPHELAEQSIKVWDDAQRLAKLRNDIAHSPILFGWHGGKSERPPDYIGAFNMTRIRERNQHLEPMVEYQTLYDAVDETGLLTRQLTEILNDVVKALNPGS